MEKLPADCVSAIMSEASPKDICRLSSVSSTFHSAAGSELVWEKMLPRQYRDIISRSATPVKTRTKKDLYLRLCNPLLIDNGRKSFRLERSTGRVSYILSARELSITWSNDRIYWAWKSTPNSRFEESVESRTVHWLEIEGRIHTDELSPDTPYAAYLIMKVSNRAYGLDVMPSETSIEIGNRVVCADLAWLHEPADGLKHKIECQVYGNRMDEVRKKVKEGDVRSPVGRGDGWMEIEVGKFFNDRREIKEEIKMSLKEVKGYQLKGGLVVEGIEIRPV